MTLSLLDRIFVKESDGMIVLNYLDPRPIVLEGNIEASNNFANSVKMVGDFIEKSILEHKSAYKPALLIKYELMKTYYKRYSSLSALCILLNPVNESISNP